MSFYMVGGSAYVAIEEKSSDLIDVLNLSLASVLIKVSKTI